MSYDGYLNCMSFVNFLHGFCMILLITKGIHDPRKNFHSNEWKDSVNAETLLLCSYLFFWMTQHLYAYASNTRKVNILFF